MNFQFKHLIHVIILSLCIGLAFMIFLPWQVALVPGFIFILFAIFHQSKNLQSEVFEINSQNKDPQKGLYWYKEKIYQHLKELNYERKESLSDHEIWIPSPRARIMGGEVKITSTPYSITIEAPRGFIRILISILEIKKIFI
jgi:hypothetical protein